ncbi:sugar-binding transcriptional regulator [Soehngenia saccharolytica]|nr:sugar-binding transcriptional regulator [Soehngenia saccharolytica]
MEVVPLDTFDMMKTIVPEALELFEKRYMILREIKNNQPIGRRMLSMKLGMTERNIRTEVEKLVEQNLLDIKNMGMYVTDEGENVLNELSDLFKKIMIKPELSKEVSIILGVRDCYVVSGNSSISEFTLKDLAKTASDLLVSYLAPSSIVGVTGGHTMLAVAEQAFSKKEFKDVTVVPARGGLGTDLKTQANTVASRLAHNIGANYKLLYIPDSLGQDVNKLANKNKEIKDTLDLIEMIDIFVFGIGRADIMAKRRNLPEEKIQFLENQQAVAEAFGHFFNIAGDDILEYGSAGLSLKKYLKIDKVIGVAGGEEKAEAIMAISSLRKDITLVIDEAVAKKIILNNF